MVKAIGSILYYTLGLWKDRYDTLHDATEVDRKRIRCDKAVKQVDNSFISKDKVTIDFLYFFKEGVSALCRMSTQYHNKWLDTYGLAVRQKRSDDKEKEASNGRRLRKSFRGGGQGEKRSANNARLHMIGG